ARAQEIAGRDQHRPDDDPDPAAAEELAHAARVLLSPKVLAEVLVGDAQVHDGKADPEHHNESPEHIKERNVGGQQLPDDDPRTHERYEEDRGDDQNCPPAPHSPALRGLTTPLST